MNIKIKLIIITISVVVSLFLIGGISYWYFISNFVEVGGDCKLPAKVCADGTKIKANPMCQYSPCPEEKSSGMPRACTMEAKLCPDGQTYVSRSGANCEFSPCPDASGQSDKIVILSPKPNAEISSPVVVSGKALPNWFFEASSPIEVHDDNGTLLGSSTTHFAPSPESFAPRNDGFAYFKGEVKFSQPATQGGYILFKKDNPSGLPEMDESFKLPVKFATAIDISSWKTYRNSNYKFYFMYPKDFVIEEGDKSFWEWTGARCQLITLNKETTVSACDKADNLTQYGLREPDGMDPMSTSDFKIGNQAAKKYASSIISYVTLSPNNNRIEFNSTDISSQSVAVIEKILSTFKFTK